MYERTSQRAWFEVRAIDRSQVLGTVGVNGSCFRLWDGKSKSKLFGSAGSIPHAGHTLLREPVLLKSASTYVVNLNVKNDVFANWKFFDSC